MAVATGITGSETVLALAGRHFRMQLYNWYDGFTPDVFHKMELYTASNLRKSAAEEEKLSDVFPNPFSSTIHLSIKNKSLNPQDQMNILFIDNVGKILFNQQSNFSLLERNVNQLAATLERGTFTLRISDVNNMPLLLQQIIKM